MNGTAAYLAAVKWEEEDLYLEDFTQKYPLPQVARITKGNLGVPGVSNPSLSQVVLFAQTGKRIKVAAQCVKFKDGSRVVPVGTKLSIPDTYEGWFEILSEDGRAVRCIESVAELAKRFPATCLVRENVKACLAKPEDSEVVSDKTRTIHTGETLSLLSVASAKSKSYLRCSTTKGETVFLNVEQKGKFSPIAGEENISGVHTIKNLATKRFPLMVRLVHGQPPSGIKNNSHFITEMRLYSLFEEECVLALPLVKEWQVVAVPPSAPLKVQAPRNPESLLQLQAVLVEKCASLVQDVSDRIQVFDISLSKEIRGERASDPTSPDNYDEIDQIYDYVRGFAPEPPPVETIPGRHIYEKVGPSNKLFIPHPISQGGKKILLKGPAQNRIQHKSKIFKHSKSSPSMKDAPSNQRQKNGRSKSLTTSPLFNIRYKSLINLAIDFDTLDSSNSGDKTSFGSGGSKEHKCERKSKLQRPKSLIDLFGEVNEIENFCKHRNSLPNGIENRKLIFSQEAANGKLLNGHHNKRIGTLYL